VTKKDGQSRDTSHMNHLHKKKTAMWDNDNNSQFARYMHIGILCTCLCLHIIWWRPNYN